VRREADTQEGEAATAARRAVVLEAADSSADLGSSAGRERMGWPGGGKKHMVGPTFLEGE
jgi:hypothetical protein